MPDQKGPIGKLLPEGFEWRGLIHAPLPNPEAMYHYCNVDGFLGIISNKELWLSSAKSMNDSTEGRYFYDNMASYAADSGDKRISQIIEQKPQPTPYMCCFSSEPDLLSQWRAYGDDGKGLAVGFKPLFMGDPKVSVNQHSPHYIPMDLILQPVVYGNSLSRDFFDRLKTEVEHVDEISAEKLAYIYRLMDFYACFEKNFYFAEEKESRLAFLPPMAHVESSSGPVVIGDLVKKFGMEGPHYRSSNGKLVPYFTYDLTEAFSQAAYDHDYKGRENKTPIFEVLLGPKCPMSVDDVVHFIDHSHFDIKDKRHEIRVVRSHGSLV